VPWGEVTISPEGEILIRGDFLFRAISTSLKDCRDIDAQGWLHTGDSVDGQ